MEYEATPADEPATIDQDRRARPAGPRVVGAQWDEVRGCWERFDENTRSWVVVGTGAPVPTPSRSTAGEDAVIDLDDHLADEDVDPDEGHIGGHHIIDLDRRPRPTDAGIPGAQWNEVVGRWEVWDPRKERWVDARSHQRAR